MANTSYTSPSLEGVGESSVSPQGVPTVAPVVVAVMAGAVWDAVGAWNYALAVNVAVAVNVAAKTNSIT